MPLLINLIVRAIDKVIAQSLQCSEFFTTKQSLCDAVACARITSFIADIEIKVVSAGRAESSYRVIPLPAVIGHKDHELLQLLNDKLDPDDMSISVRDGSAKVLLRAIDIGQLRQTINALSATTDTSDVLTAVLLAVEGIKSYGIRAGKRYFVGYAEARKVVDRADKELRRGKHYYANDHPYVAANNSPPRQFIDKIIASDAEKVLPELPDNCVDLVFTSPPYNFGLDYGNSADDTKWEEYFQKLFAIFDECIRVLKFGGRIVVNVQPLFSDYIPSHHIISAFFMRRHLIWKGELLWEKNNYNCKYTAWGSWKSPASPYLKYTWEFIEIFAKGSLQSKGDKDDADITADEFKQWVNAKWSIAPERRMRHYGHPAMFPEELATRVLKLFSFAGSFVLDPFAGVGTTAVAAQKLQRHYLGIDISPRYCQTAETRLTKARLTN